MATAITDFYDFMRVMLQDHDAGARLYEDATLRNAVRGVVGLMRVPGLKLSPDQLSVYVTGKTLEPGGDNGGREWALVGLYGVLALVSGTPSEYSYRTRAIAEKFGSIASFTDYLTTEIYFLEENGAMVGGWQQFAGWFEAHAGVDFWKLHTKVTVDGPFQQVTYTANGASTGSPAES
jgi:hypothetical protein